MSTPLIECVPNFSEGRNPEIIKQITQVIEEVEGVMLLDVDPGKATNRTVVTFVGQPGPVIEAAFRAIKKAAEVIDMRQHKGEHPRMGATDVCPLIPVSGISMEETAKYAQQLAARVGAELNIPVYLYESAQSNPERKNLSVIRAGEYEGFFEKILQPEWKPDFGPAAMNAKAGASVIGARDFLIAYNTNLNTTSVRLANSVAFDVRENGRILREGHPVLGEIVKDASGEPVRIPGALKHCKAIGWYIEEYGIAQVSMNLTNYKITPLHSAFEECRKSADKRGMRVTGSELVGLVPKEALLEAGRYFLLQQGRSTGVSEEELIHIAVKSMGLDELGKFEPRKKVIEYLLEDRDNAKKLVNLSLRGLANETASESPAPGGGSIAAAVGSLGAALGTMVANLSSGKRGWEDRLDYFSAWAVKGQAWKDQLLGLVDEDTHSFNQVMNAFGLPKNTPEEKAERSKAIESATLYAAQVPLKVVQTCQAALSLAKEMVEKGNPNSVTDGMVGALCLLTGAEGAFYNVKINLASLKDKNTAGQLLSEGQQILDMMRREVEQLRAITDEKIGG